MSKPWRLFTTWDGDPGFNMAMDEALFLHGDERPSLRFYTWRPCALSLGYFQRVADVPEVSQADVCVRRLTGGGAIHHANELTFSITAPVEHPLYRGEVKRSYERVHGLLATVFSQLGVDAALRGALKLRSDSAGSGMCFHVSTPLDLAWSSRKGVGSAQRRSQGRVLHHGSIKMAATELDTGIAGLHEYAPALTPEKLAPRIREHFAKELGITYVEEALSEKERQHVRERASFFTSKTFVHRR